MGKNEGEKRRPLYRLSPLPSLLMSIEAERRLHQTGGTIAPWDGHISFGGLLS